MLGCRYHGWSYSTEGNLVKAPKFEKVQGFNREDNGLFEVGVRVNDKGLIFVGIDDTKTAESRRPVRLIGSLVDTWELEGKFNWKLVGMYVISIGV